MNNTPPEDPPQSRQTTPALSTSDRWKVADEALREYQGPDEWKTASPPRAVQATSMFSSIQPEESRSSWFTGRAMVSVLAVVAMLEAVALIGLWLHCQSTAAAHGPAASALETRNDAVREAVRLRPGPR
jgi:hypothetical protein